MRLIKKNVVFLEVDEPAAEAHSVNLFWRIWVQAGRQAGSISPPSASGAGGIMRQHAWCVHSNIYASESFRSSPQEHFVCLCLYFSLFPLSLFLYHALSLSNTPTPHPPSHSFCVIPAAHGADSLRIAQSSTYCIDTHWAIAGAAAAAQPLPCCQAAGALNSHELLMQLTHIPSTREVWILSAHSMVTTAEV